jgi:hypothetical protein
MMLPFWPQSEGEDPDAGRFDRYIAEGKSIFRLVPLDESDLAVYPDSPTRNPQRFKEFQALTAPLPLAAFFNDDSEAVLDYRDGTYVFRTSFRKSLRRPTEFAMPGWSADHGAFPAFPWSPRPVVGFCGQMDDFGIRRSALDALEADGRISTGFIRREHFWGGRFAGVQDVRKVRREFLDNMAGSGYVLCARGGGNFSYRIYEVMSCGRIPLFVDTDCVLPYEFLVGWRNLFPTVDLADVKNIGDVLLGFHSGLGPCGFQARQAEMRRLWEKWISPLGFFSNFHRHFPEE